nr:hypothetical protein [Sulfurospirillum sp. 'SP']
MSQITLESNEEVTISRKTKYEYPPYFMAGNGNKNKYGTSLNLIEYLCSFNKTEQFAFLKVIEKLDCILDSRKKHNLCKVAMKELTSSEQQKFKAGISTLIKKGLVKRSKKEHYIINPNLIISKEYSTDLEKWNAIK